MKTLMYPIVPDDDFPEMFCAIRPCSGEHQFYKPEGERTNALLSRMNRKAMEMEEAIDSLTDRDQRLRVNNAMLRELCDELINLAQALKVDSQRLAELQRRALHLGVEVDK
jgi:uncharacterized protein YaaN involved in tellurite resistance